MRMPEIERIFALSRRRHLLRSWCRRFPAGAGCEPPSASLIEIILEAQMLDAAAPAPHQLQGLDPDLDVLFDIVRGHGSDPTPRSSRPRGSSAGRTPAAARRSGCGWRSPRRRSSRSPCRSPCVRVAAQLFLEAIVVLPDPAVGRVDGAGPVIVTEIADHGRHRALQLERRQRRDFRRQIIVRGAFAANGGDRQDQIADLVLAFQAAALAEEQHGLRRDGARAGPSPSRHSGCPCRN